MDAFALLIAATLNAGTVLAIASLGLLINERAGVLNLGAEGLMLVAAIAGFATAVHTGSDVLAFGAGMAAGALLAAIFGWLVIWLNTNQYATGLALSLFGAGFSAFVGIQYTQEKIGDRLNFQIPGLADIPFFGPALFRQHPMVYATVLATAALAWFLYRSRAGLVLRAVGESPEAAHALGYPVRRIRLAAVVVGGALCGLSGAYISVIYTPLWVEGMIAGKGWIALAFGLGWFLYRSRAGLVLRAVGESPESAMRWVIRCGDCGSPRWWRAARCAGWRGLTCRSSTRRCGWRA